MEKTLATKRHAPTSPSGRSPGSLVALLSSNKRSLVDECSDAASCVDALVKRLCDGSTFKDLAVDTPYNRALVTQALQSLLHSQWKLQQLANDSAHLRACREALEQMPPEMWHYSMYRIMPRMSDRPSALRALRAFGACAFWCQHTVTAMRWHTMNIECNNVKLPLERRTHYGGPGTGRPAVPIVYPNVTTVRIDLHNQSNTWDAWPYVARLLNSSLNLDTCRVVLLANNVRMHNSFYNERRNTVPLPQPRVLEVRRAAVGKGPDKFPSLLHMFDLSKCRSLTLAGKLPLAGGDWGCPKFASTLSALQHVQCDELAWSLVMHWPVEVFARMDLTLERCADDDVSSALGVLDQLVSTGASLVDSFALDAGKAITLRMCNARAVDFESPLTCLLYMQMLAAHHRLGVFFDARTGPRASVRQRAVTLTMDSDVAALAMQVYHNTAALDVCAWAEEFFPVLCDRRTLDVTPPLTPMHSAPVSPYQQPAPDSHISPSYDNAYDAEQIAEGERKLFDANASAYSPLPPLALSPAPPASPTPVAATTAIATTTTCTADFSLSLPASPMPQCEPGPQQHVTETTTTPPPPPAPPVQSSAEPDTLLATGVVQMQAAAPQEDAPMPYVPEPLPQQMPFYSYISQPPQQQQPTFYVPMDYTDYL